MPAFLCPLDLPGYQIRMSQEVANFFVAEARRNLHKASSQKEEDEVLVYNWLPDFTGEAGSGGGWGAGQARSGPGEQSDQRSASLRSLHAPCLDGSGLP